MFIASLNEAELAILCWYRSLNHWQTIAVNVWLLTGDGSHIAVAFSRQNQLAAA